MLSTLSRFRGECTAALASAISALYHIQVREPALQDPPSQEFGQLVSSVSFELPKTLEKNPARKARFVGESI